MPKSEKSEALITEVKGWLDTAESWSSGSDPDPLKQAASALTGMLALLVGVGEKEAEENGYRDDYFEADRILGDVLAFAEDLVNYTPDDGPRPTPAWIGKRLKAILDGEVSNEGVPEV